eukprot:6940651-Ditylum_brightwellii.AAC.2
MTPNIGKWNGLRKKTGSANVMTFSSDKDDLEVDMFHSMAYYLLTQEGKYTSKSENAYVFPCFANLQKGGAADKVSNAIDACVEKCEEVTPDMTSSELRVASSYEMVSHLLLNVVGHCPMYCIDSVMNDGNWENILCYITQLFLSSTGKASINNDILITLKKYFFASLLFWLPDFISDYGTDNIVIK